MKKLLILQIATLFPLISNADNQSLNFQNKNFENSYRVKLGSALGKNGANNHIDLVGLSYEKDLNDVLSVTTGFNINLPDSSILNYESDQENDDYYGFGPGKAQYKELFVNFKKPINDNIDALINFKYGFMKQNSNENILDNNSYEDYKNKEYSVEAILKYEDSYKYFTYCLGLGALLQRGNVINKFGETGEYGIMKYDYLNIGYIINPEISYNFTKNLKLSANYKRIQTEDLSINNDKYYDTDIPGYANGFKVIDNERLENTFGLGLSYKF